MKQLVVAMAIVAILVPCGAAAQEQRGSIEGAVRDASGGALPGTTVEARNIGVGGTVTSVTDGDGIYRFPALPPGRYEIVAALQGFTSAKSPEVRLELGQILKVDLEMAVAGLAETVTVRQDSPLIDVKQNAAGAVVPREIIERIPKARSFETLVTSAPGITDETATRSRGIQIDGSSGADNRFVVDGVDTTSILVGTSARSVASDFVEEVQAKASGYNAEYRAAIGGVISAITRSGTNSWRGSGGFYTSTDRFESTQRPTLRLNPLNNALAEYTTPRSDDFNSWDLVGDVGGPLIRSRTWFYAGYNPTWTTTTRTVIFRSNGQQETFERQPIDHTGYYNVSGQIRPDLRLKVSGSNRRTRGGLALPAIEADGSSLANPALFPSPTRTDEFNDIYSASADWVISPHTFANITTSYFTYGTEQVGTFSDVPRHTFQTTNNGIADIPAALKQPSGYADFPASTRGVRNDQGRFNFNADVTRYGTWHGQHTAKAGIQYERQHDDVLSGAQAETIELYWDSSYATNDGRRVRGTYGYYNVTRLYTEGDINADNLGFFVQDAWTIGKGLTLNLGLRTEREDVPSYRPENPGVHFTFGDKIAPRVGFAWDVKGDSSLKLFGSWGVFHDLMKMTMGRVMFGADRWVNYYYTLDTFDWPSISCGYPPSGCPGTLIQSFDFRPVANNPSLNVVDPELDPIRSQEFTIGTDYELSRTMSFGTRYVHKWLDRTIEAVCALVPEGELCGVNNPGFGEAVHPLGAGLPAQPPAERNYNGLEFRLRKRYADRWSADVSYLLSRLTGNWSGIASTDEAVSSLQPNSGRAFDLLYYSFDAQGQPSDGLLATDRTHQFKGQATYDFPWGTLLGVNYLLQSGVPVSSVINQKNIGFFPYGRGDLGRTPVFSQTDFYLQQAFTVGKVQMKVGANVTNLFNQDTAAALFVRPYRDGFNLADDVFFAGFDPAAIQRATPSIRPDPRYQLPNSFQGRRVLRLDMKVSF
jgi:Carboxypeptidase regulatory-like domain/TonB dependent receptor-like, beta-barrel